MVSEHNRGGLKVVSATNKDVYTQKTSTWCHWCCHPYDSIPVGLPIRYREHKAEFTLSGTYCSYACVLAANKHRNDARATERSMWVRMLAKLWHGIPMRTRLRMAPDRRALTVFGGSMDIHEFRGCQEDLIVQLPPIVDITPEDHVILSRLRQPQRVPSTLQLGQAHKPRPAASARSMSDSTQARTPPGPRKLAYKIRKPVPKYNRTQLQSLGIKVE